MGWYSDHTGLHGFLCENGIYTTLDVPGSMGDTQAYGINDSGQIVGYYFDATGQHGFLYENGGYTTLNLPSSIISGSEYYGFPFTVPQTGITNSGQIVGYYIDAFGYHGFLATPVP